MFIINFVDINPQECTEEWYCAGEKTNSCLPNPREKYTQITHPCENNASVPQGQQNFWLKTNEKPVQDANTGRSHYAFSSTNTADKITFKK